MQDDLIKRHIQGNEHHSKGQMSKAKSSALSVTRSHISILSEQKKRPSRNDKTLSEGTNAK